MPDREGGLRVLLMSRHWLLRVVKLWADGGYRGKFVEWIRQVCHWVVEITLPPAGSKGFQVVPKRWIVERTFAWLLNSRRLSKDYEYLFSSSTGMIYAAMIRVMLQRLAKA